MTNSSLQRFDQGGIELIINTETGESFASISGYARMSGKIPSTISRRLTMMGLREKGLEQAQIETASGLRTVALIPENLICQWLIKDNHELALKVMQLGVRLFLHTIAGFQVKSDAIETNKQLENQIAELTAKIDKLDYREVDYIDEILGLKDRIKELESENSTLEEKIEFLEEYV
jgi:DNA repair exonuclease SbcCD ATPase subunit